MLGSRVISESAISSLPDRLTNRILAFGEILGTFDAIVSGPARAILIEEAPVFAVEITLSPVG